MTQLVFFGRPLPEWVSARSGLSLLVKTSLAIGALSAILFSSITLYSIFYRLYVPKLVHDAPVYLQYSSPTNVSASVSLVPQSNYKFLSASQAYSVSLVLDVPTSETNQMLGNFMVSLELCDRSGKPVHKSSRPSIAPYRSGLVKLMHTLVKAVPLALGISREETTLDIELVSGLYDKHYSPITNARIFLSKPLQVYAARVVFIAEFTGLRYWMYYWRVPTATVFVSIAVMWQLAFAVVSWSVLETYTRSRLVSAVTNAMQPGNAGSGTDNSAPGYGEHRQQQILLGVPGDGSYAGAASEKHTAAHGHTRSLTPSPSATIQNIPTSTHDPPPPEQEVPSEADISTPDADKPPFGSLRHRQPARPSRQ